jgi:hypothetical protein
MNTETCWRKSSYSTGNGGNCVEVGTNAPGIMVRDTKDRGNGPVLRVTPQDWKRFTASMK